MIKMMMMVAMTVCCMAASAQNEVGQLTLQPKIGLNLANLTNVEIITNSSYEFSNIVIDGRYNLGLTKVNKNGDDSNKNSVIQLTVGYKFAL